MLFLKCTTPAAHISSWQVQREYSKCRLWKKKVHVQIPAPPRAVDKNQLLGPKSQFPHLYNRDDNSTSFVVRIKSMSLAHVHAQFKSSHLTITAA